MANIWIFFLLLLFIILLSTTNGYYMEWRNQCIYSKSDLSDMVLISSCIFNKIKYRWFNSTFGWNKGYTEFGIYNAEKFNNDTAFLLSQRAGVENFCKNNARNRYTAIIGRSVEPQVKVRSVKQSDGSHPTMLMCSAYNFYPKYIQVTWLRDGQEIKGGVTSIEEMSSGDWYYQVHSHLEYMPKSGEEISCMVEHISFGKPMIYKWNGSGPGRIKIAIGSSGLVLGIILSTAGFIYYKT